MLEKLKIVRKKVSSNEIEDAFALFEQIIDFNRDLKDLLFIQKANYYELLRRSKEGTIANEEENVSRNKVISKLLFIANELENSYLIANRSNTPSPPSNVDQRIRINQLDMIISSQKKTKKSYRSICLVFLLVALILVVSFALFLRTLNHQLYLSTATLLFSLLGGVVPYREVIRRTEVIESLLTLKVHLQKLENQPHSEDRKKMIDKIDSLIYRKLEDQLMIN